MRKYILSIILILFLGLGGVFNADTMALDSDYKNNLLKVDINKVNDGSYKIDLFTQKPYNEPVKVIKKSDTSYYVLLPETYHSITSVGASGDVNKVDVKLYPYAGQDLNNGYTKINITTNKPVNFSTNVRTASSDVPRIDAKKLAQLDSAFEGKPSYKEPVRVESTKNVQKTTAKTVVPSTTGVKEQPKTAASSKVASNNAPHRKSTVETGAGDKRIAQNQGNEIEIITKPKKDKVNDIKAQEAPKPENTLKTGEGTPADLVEVIETETGSDASLEEDAKEQGLTELATGDEEVIPEMTRNQRIMQKVKLVAHALLDNALLLIAIVLLIIALILLIRPKTAKTANAANASAGNAFGGLPTPDGVGEGLSEDIHVETPQLSETYTGAADTLSAVQAASDVYEPKPMQTYEEAEGSAVATASREDETEEVQEAEDEASVLASESFGENRGLCLVNYDGSIALIGYIGEEIFVIQNFGKITLINPQIQVRVAEQNENDTIYIVKTANSKLMVRETKTLIGLEMVM